MASIRASRRRAPDLAAKHLEGKVEAARFVEGEEHEVIDAVAPLRRAPSHDAALDTEALKGERVTVYETNEEGWAWGQLERDGYVGWLPDATLLAPRPHADPQGRGAAHVRVPRPVDQAAAGRDAAARREDRRRAHDGTFAVTAAGASCPAASRAARHDRHDFVAVAERFLGVPYLWGGKTSLGLDCSGLVQVALTACGIACPRDSDMQEQALGERSTDAISPASDAAT